MCTEVRRHAAFLQCIPDRNGGRDALQRLGNVLVYAANIQRRAGIEHAFLPERLIIQGQISGNANAVPALSRGVYYPPEQTTSGLGENDESSLQVPPVSVPKTGSLM